MKRTVLFLSTLFFCALSFSQTVNQQVKDSEGKVKLLGIINKEGLTKKPFKEWFNKNHDDYLVNDRVIEKLEDSLNNYTIKVFLGTWCGDSKREVPRFYSVLESANFPKGQLEIIAVDKTEKAYKQAPNGEEKGLNIHRVPTFILYKAGKEVNRIVEFPVETLEKDLLTIVTSNKYTPNYMAANYLSYLLENKSLEELTNKEKELVPQFAEFVKGSRELNTYGYMLLRSKQFEKSLFVFNLNTKIFPYKYNVFDSLGEAYFAIKNYSEALKNYATVLELKPKDENAISMIEKINKEML